MNDELIKKARQTDLAQYLMSRGEKLIKNGTRYRLEKHNSLVFTKNMFYWNSHSIHGNAVDFLIMYYDMDFKKAVKELTGQDIKSDYKFTQTKFDYNSIKINCDYKRAIAYLCKTRKINYNLIITLIKKNLIYQEEKTNNIIFTIRNRKGEVVGVEYNGTMSQRRFKGIAKNSKYGYGFNVIYGTPKNAVFFESAVDLISFIDIKNREQKRLKNLILVSMSGLKMNIIKNMLKSFSISNEPILCVDNDDAGKKFIDTVKILYKNTKVYFPDNGLKDWNDYLKSIK